MLTTLLAFVAVALTCLMFGTRDRMLGFPATIFWALLSGQAYTLYVTLWDIYYLLFFASMGMAIFSMIAAFALRKQDLEPSKSDLLESGKFIDEGKSNGEETPEESEQPIDEPSTPNRRTQELHERAAQRRTGGHKRRPWHWGEWK